LKKIALLPPVIAAAVLVCLLAHASTLVSLDLPELVFMSEAVVVGRVVKSSSFLEGSRIYTVHEVSVTESISSDATLDQQKIEIMTLGGKTEHFSQVVFGEAELKKGSLYLLFLKCRDYHWVPAGMAQGAYPVIWDESSGEYEVRPALINADLVRITADGIKGARQWIAQYRPLDDVIEQIRSLME